MKMTWKNRSVAEKGRYDGLKGPLGAVFDGDRFWYAKCDPAILGGVALGFLLMHAGTGGMAGLRILKTFNVLFAQVLKFIVPLCANVHMVGSAIKMIASTLAVVVIYNLDVGFGQFAHFTFMFAIAAVAAPGVMCGVLMASVGFVEFILGLLPEQVAVMMTFYMALDGYGPAANVTGDGAIALICERLFGRGE